jgi:hypothetical protein
MNKSIPILIILIFFSVSAHTQDFLWKANVYSFFNNNEFGGSKFKIPQTMSGIQAAPEIGIRFDTVHTISGGVNILNEFGSKKAVDKIYPTVYYEFNKAPYRFLMGAFPRSAALNKYPRVFFQDSIAYFRPNMTGIFWELSREKGYFNLWLDWTSQISVTERETFFTGLSGRYNAGKFYLQHFNYMFHYAKDFDPVIEKGIYDNALMLTSVGVNLSELTFFDCFDINAGWLSGIERSRAENTGWIINNGFLMETHLAYRRFGIFNTLYIGEGQMPFYAAQSNKLYWGDPIYRAGNYNRSDFCIDFIKTSKVKLQLAYSLHFAERNVFHEQLLTLQIALDNFR